jgi:hypothetical protein
MNFRKCKQAPVLNGKIFWFHLPQSASEWISLGILGYNFPKCVESTQKEDADTNVEQTLSIENEKGNLRITSDSESISALPKMTSDEKKVYNQWKGKGFFKREEVDILIGSKRTKALEVINPMIKKGLIKHSDAGGSETEYRIVTDN